MMRRIFSWSMMTGEFVTCFLGFWPVKAIG
jgi:hypothetical protein